MIRDLGIVAPGTTLYIPFHTFDSNDPSASVTLTGLATTDIEIFKDGSTTQRASDAGYALLDTDGIDFDGITGIHGLSINLADNTTAGFYAAGSQYWVVISSVTVDAATVNFVLGTFRIGYPTALLNTTIATLASQTSFTLTAGPAEDDALNGWTAIIHDAASAVQCGLGVVADYTGSTRTVTLTSGVTFTAAAGDNISFFPPANAAWGGAVAYTTTRGLAGTALPNAAAEAAGGLYTRGSGAGQINQNANGQVDSRAVSLAADVITAAAAAADFGTEIATAVWASATRVLTAGTNIVLAKGTGITGFNDLDAAGIRGAVGLASANLDTQLAAIDDYIDSEIAAILAAVDTEIAALVATLGTAGAGLTAVPWNAAWDAEVQSEVQDAIEANHLDHLLAATYDPASKPGAADALLNELVESDGGVSRFTANALEQGPSGGGGVADWTADERTAIRATLGIPSTGTTPDDPTTGILDAIRDVVAAIETDTQDLQSRTPAALVGGRMAADVGSISGDATAADNAEAFFDGTGYAGTGNTIPTVTTLTNAPSDPAGVTTLLSRLSATRAGYLDNLSAGAVATAAKLLSYFQSALRSDVTVDSDIGGTYDDATDSQQAIRDRGDAAWTTATGFSTLDAAGIRAAVGLASPNLDTQLAAIDDLLDTEVAAILVDTGTTLDDLVDDLETRLTAALATKLAQHAAGVLAVVVGSGSTTTAVVLSTVEGAAPSAVDDFYNGAVLILTSGALAGQRTDITDYTGGTVTATVTALTGAPANGVTGLIV